MTKYYPIFLNLKNKLCIVIGGGKVAERKILSLLSCGAKVKIISPEITPKLKELSEKGEVFWEARSYREGDLEEAFLAIAATNEPEIQKKIFQEAEEKKIPCNVVDAPEFCSFIVPSLITRGDLQIAISTGGSSPAVAKRIRETLENFFGEEYEIYLKLMKRIREFILKKVSDPKEREKKLKILASAPFPEYIKNKDYNLISYILEKEGLANLLSEFEFSFYKDSKANEKKD